MVAQDQPLQLKIDLVADEKTLIDNKTQRILDVTAQFTLERQECKKFRLQGQIECLSPITGIFKTSDTIADLYNYKTIDDVDSDFYTIKDFFNVTVLYPSKFILQADGSYNLLLLPITTSSIPFFNSGFYTNIFYEQIFQFIVEDDIDITDLVTTSSNNRFRLPVNELFIFFNFMNTESKFTHEYMGIDPITGLISLKSGNITQNEINNGIYGGNYNLDFINYNFTVNHDSVSNIYFNLTDRTLKYNYTPFKTVNLQLFSGSLDSGNITNTDGIPYYAYLADDNTNNNNANYVENFVNTDFNIFSGTTRLTNNDPLFMLPRKLIFNTNNNFFEYYLDNNLLDNSYFTMILNGIELVNGVDYILSETQLNKVILRIKINFNDTINCQYLYGENYVWRQLLDIGYIEPNSGIGVDYPFLNGFNYIFSNNKLVITPDLTDSTTNSEYSTFLFSTTNEAYKNNSLNNGGC